MKNKISRLNLLLAFAIVTVVFACKEEETIINDTAYTQYIDKERGFTIEYPADWRKKILQQKPTCNTCFSK